jgi:hypothetical protein
MYKYKILKIPNYRIAIFFSKNEITEYEIKNLHIIYLFENLQKVG